MVLAEWRVLIDKPKNPIAHLGSQAYGWFAYSQSAKAPKWVGRKASIVLGKVGIDSRHSSVFRVQIKSIAPNVSPKGPPLAYKTKVRTRGSDFCKIYNYEQLNTIYTTKMVSFSLCISTLAFISLQNGRYAEPLILDINTLKTLHLLLVVGRYISLCAHTYAKA